MIPALNTVILLTLLSYCDGKAFTFCKSTEKDFKDCLKKSAQEVILLSINDIPEYDLPSLIVYKTPNVTIQAGIGAVDLIQNYKNVEIYGVTDAIVNDAYFDKDKKIFGLTLTIPKYTQKADYTIEGKLLSIPVVGSGSSILEFDNFQMKNVLHLEEYIRDGKTYYKIKSYDLDLSTTKLYSHFDNMFNGNKLLGDNINKLLNEEWEVVFQDTKSATENAFKGVIQPYMQKFFDKIPANELF